ncbi:hypothetical protein IJG79_00355 [Candidatus Saccharibacteria bacterium]|nr:hypothetical protein [Candidatus Saccharibacteria bacterium]
MQLLIMLLIAVSILTLLSGISVLFGARKGERFQAILFFLVTLFAFGWALAIGIFLSLPESTTPETAQLSAFSMYIPVLFMPLGLACYPIYRYKLGKVIIFLCLVACISLLIFMLIDPNLLYSSITISENTGNAVHLQHNLYNYLYMGYFIITCLIYMIGLWYNARHTKSPNLKKAYNIVLIGFTTTGIIALIFNAILPFLGKYDTVWAGPLAMSFAWVLHYYAILRYRLIDLSGRWLRALSHIIIMSLAAIVYLTIFFIIFIALFKIPSPSSSVILLNVIMIIIVLLLFPVLNEVSAYVRSLASIHDIDLVYLVKKLDLLSKEYINYHELAGFLADHLHFQYVGLLIDDKLYGSQNSKLTTAELNKIANIKIKNNEIWATLTEETEDVLKKHGIEAVATLRNAHGQPIGKILIGRPLGNVSFANRDIRSLETAFILIAHTIESDKNPSQI